MFSKSVEEDYSGVIRVSALGEAFNRWELCTPQLLVKIEKLQDKHCSIALINVL